MRSACAEHLCIALLPPPLTPASRVSLWTNSPLMEEGTFVPISLAWKTIVILFSSELCVQSQSFLSRIFVDLAQQIQPFSASGR